MSVSKIYNLIMGLAIVLTLFFNNNAGAQTHDTWDITKLLGLMSSDYTQSAFLTSARGLNTSEPDGIIFHFHGDHQTVKKQFIASEFNGVLVSLELGALSGSYERKYFSDKDKFTGLLSVTSRFIRDTLKMQIPDTTPVFLTAFSAGYAGVRAILRNHYEKISGIGLADGLYADFDPDSLKKQMPDFQRIAAQAVKSEKKFILTHSSLTVKDYMTASATADLILNKLGLSRTKKGFNDETGFLESAAEKGKLLIKGYTYSTPADHYSHLNHIGRVFSFLKK